METSLDQKINQAPKKFVKIIIKDHGKGIEKDNLERIFDPYFTTKEMGTNKGSGLGLTTVYSIISRHDGRIVVDSESGKGTLFSVYIPAFEEKVQLSESVNDHEVVKSKALTRKILVMDDEEMIRTVTMDTLSIVGFKPEAAENGNQALALYKDAMQKGSSFDLVILDLTVKKGMGGKACLEKLIAIDPAVKAIVSSGYSDDPVMTDYKKYGFKFALPKPYNKDELEAAIHKVIVC